MAARRSISESCDREDKYLRVTRILRVSQASCDVGTNERTKYYNDRSIANLVSLAAAAAAAAAAAGFPFLSQLVYIVTYR